MKYVNSSNSIGLKVTGVCALIFLFSGGLFLYFDPTVPFMWAWTLFMLVGFSLWLHSYLNRHKWVFEVTSDHIFIESPFSPKFTVRMALIDIQQIRFFDGDTTSAEILEKDGKTTNVPGQCLPRIREIADSLKKLGVTVFLNNKSCE